jgi:hypothetical protein
MDDTKHPAKRYPRRRKNHRKPNIPSNAYQDHNIRLYNSFVETPTNKIAVIVGADMDGAMLVCVADKTAPIDLVIQFLRTSADNLDREYNGDAPTDAASESLHDAMDQMNAATDGMLDFGFQMGRLHANCKEVRDISESILGIQDRILRHAATCHLSAKA